MVDVRRGGASSSLDFSSSRFRSLKREQNTYGRAYEYGTSLAESSVSLFRATRQPSYHFGWFFNSVWDQAFPSALQLFLNVSALQFSLSFASTDKLYLRSAVLDISLRVERVQ